jgi:hypothetical protein
MPTDIIRAKNKKDARFRFYFEKGIYTIDNKKLRHQMSDKIVSIDKTSIKLSDGMYWFDIEYKK